MWDAWVRAQALSAGLTLTARFSCLRVTMQITIHRTSKSIGVSPSGTPNHWHVVPEAVMESVQVRGDDHSSSGWRRPIVGPPPLDVVVFSSAPNLGLI